MRGVPETLLKFLDQVNGIEGASVLEKDGFDCALTVVFDKPAEIIIGRALHAHPNSTGRRIALKNPAVSRTHCVIGTDSRGAYVKDVGTGARGSTNGTYVNDRRLEPGQKVYISDRDLVTLGKPQLPCEVVLRVVVKKSPVVELFSSSRKTNSA